MQRVSLKTYFSKKTKEQLIEELQFLAKRFSQVKEYYHFQLSPEKQEKILDEYKRRIKREFFPERGFGGGRPSVGKAPILQFLKISTFPDKLVDLMLYYVEQGVKYTLAYGDIDEPFYESIESVYEDSLDLIKENNLYEQFRTRCKKVKTDTNGMGWGFGDYIEELFEKYYKES